MNYYHVTEDLGESIILTPRVPRYCLPNEGDIPRICVSSSIYNCVRALAGSVNLKTHHIQGVYGLTRQLCVYETDESPYLPPDCSDFRRNNEMWFIKDTAFKRLGFICSKAWNSGNILVVKENSTFESVVHGLRISRKEVK